MLELALDARLHGNALQEVLLRAQVQHERRHHGHQTGRDHVRPALLVLTHQQAQTSGQRLVVDVGHDDTRPEVVVPCAIEGEQTDNDHDRHDGRQDDLGINLEAGSAVNGRRFVQCLRNALHEVADQEDIEDAGQHRPDQRVEVVDPAQRIGNTELRKDRNDVREHAHVHEGPEDLVAALEVQTLIRIRGQGGDEHRAHRHRDGDDEGVVEHQTDVRVRIDVRAAKEELRVVGGRPGLRNQAGQIIHRTGDVREGRDEVSVKLEGVGDQPDDRLKPADAQNDQEQERDQLASFILCHNRSLLNPAGS